MDNQPQVHRSLRLRSPVLRWAKDNRSNRSKDKLRMSIVDSSKSNNYPSYNSKKRSQREYPNDDYLGDSLLMHFQIAKILNAHQLLKFLFDLQRFLHLYEAVLYFCSSRTCRVSCI